MQLDYTIPKLLGHATWFHLRSGSKNIKSSLYSRHYAEAYNEWRCPSPRLAPGQHSSEKTSQWRRGVGDTVSDFTGLGIEPKTFHSSSDVFNATPNEVGQMDLNHISTDIIGSVKSILMQS